MGIAYSPGTGIYIVFTDTECIPPSHHEQYGLPHVQLQCMELDCSLGLVVLSFNNNSCMQQYSGDNTTAVQDLQVLTPGGLPIPSAD